MPNNGYIKLHRTLQEWGWYKDLNVKSVFLHLLLNANHTDQKWRGIVIKKGQLVTSRDILARDLGMSTQSVRTALSKLSGSNQQLTNRQKTGVYTDATTNSVKNAHSNIYCINEKSTNEITIKSTNRFSLITIVNWDVYQGKSTSKSTSKLTNNQPTTNQQLTTNKNDKNVKNDKNIDLDISHIKIQEGMKSLKDSLVQKGIIHETI